MGELKAIDQDSATQDNLWGQIDQEFLANYPSPHTRRAYQSDIKQFFTFLQQHYPKLKRFDQITRALIIHYRNHLQEFAGKGGSPMAPKSVARKIASLDSYFDFLIEHRNLLPFNPTSSIKRPKQEVRAPTQYVPREYVLAMFDKARESKLTGPMHQALLMTYFMTGLRTSEILALQIKDILKINECSYFRVVGKGAKIFHKQLMPTLKNAIDDYLNWMKECGRSLKPDDWLFRPCQESACDDQDQQGDCDRPLNPSSVNRLIDKYAKAVGLQGHVSAHSARATFITDYLQNGADLKEVAMEVSHASTTTTEIYDKRRQKLQKNLQNKLGY